MKGLFSLICFLLIGTGVAFGQNLVLNPSFEEHRACPEKLGNFNTDLVSWTTPTLGSTDYFHGCSDAMGTPENFNGTQLADFGQGYAGFYLYAPNDYREYMQATLSSPLVEGVTYELSFFVSLAERSDFAINAFGVVFSNEPLQFEIQKDLSKHHLYSDPNNPFSYVEIGYSHFANDKKEWMLVTTSYTASGGERYMTLGNFKNNARTRKFLIKKDAKQGAYYYVDMVSLMPPDNGKTGVIAGRTAGESTPSLNTPHLFQHVLFDFDEYHLLDSAREYLKETFDFLMADPTLHIVIHGHTDGIGLPEYNMKLSGNRCKAVVDYFTGLGLPEARISWKGHGGSLPVADNATPEGRQQNRRVEFILTRM
ncbi:Outer membrane protein OmpA [Muriicola jejuensis]|uniref:OmpA family protein n=1 Tax=Muriicola jejuensis TaxID=504488 RepID=A0A6P0UBC7_9FLAO|nr:OmpA family protein [Muriicola jejuensis]NER10601.1 OmpA family protein [Muriicola jejuensis]SMP17642.1 Outer membrane protein OmpA [Muriicola jejuensis]